ncbi:hypothetical protein DB30_00273 [Enhygromyxa salina]|uniref:Uncharacterized protein n=1 Tax=Enhygromyxa salina TaxID=215803 RepID=A0A0C2A584_9BACT|nr:hypothetical protein DB30_00273 [Enhygromyxa salina]
MGCRSHPRIERAEIGRASTLALDSSEQGGAGSTLVRFGEPQNAWVGQ